MKIAKTRTNLNENSYEIYLSGCEFKCEGCHNPELQSFDVGTEWKECIDKILDELNSFPFKYIFLLGGEPLHQDNQDLIDFISLLDEKTCKDIVLFTGYDIEYIEKRPYRRWLQLYIEYIKCGRYLKDSESYIEPILGIKLASKNQKIYKL